MQDLFTFEQQGVLPDGKIVGQFKPTGAIPTWFDQLKGRGIECDVRMFDPDFAQDTCIRMLKRC
jgi:pilus assembly protein CpaF